MTASSYTLSHPFIKEARNTVTYLTEKRLVVFRNKMLKRIYGPKIEVTRRS
jgi:hypothetical protein